VPLKKTLIAAKIGTLGLKCMLNTISAPKNHAFYHSEGLFERPLSLLADFSATSK